MSTPVPPRPVTCDECKAPIEAERGWRLALAERPFRQYRLCSWACTQAVSHRGGPPLPTQAQSA